MPLANHLGFAGRCASCQWSVCKFPPAPQQYRTGRFPHTKLRLSRRASWRTEQVPCGQRRETISNMAELPASKLQKQADVAPSWGAELERLLRALSDDEELLDEASHALQAATTGAAFDASPPVAALARHCDTPSRRGEVASRVFYLQQDFEQRAAFEAATLQAKEIDDLI